MYVHASAMLIHKASIFNTMGRLELVRRKRAHVCGKTKRRGVVCVFVEARWEEDFLFPKKK